jgi:peroxiredoxin
MKTLMPFIAVLTLCSFLLVDCAPVKIRQKAPDFLTSTIDGERFALKDYVGQQGGNRVLILAFFNTGCKPCEGDLRYLQRLYEQYRKDGLDVVCIFTEHPNKPDVVKKFTEKLDLKLPVLLDKHGTISKRYRVNGLPCQYVVDKEGFLRFRYLGCSEGVKAKLEENLRELLSASYSPSFLNQENCRPGMESHSGEVNPFQQ